MRLIISLSGKAMSGKDSIADVLVSKYNYTKLSFARNLKNMCQDIFKLTPVQTDTTEGKMEKFHTPVLFSEEQFELILQWIHKTHNILLNEYIHKIDMLRDKYVNQILFHTPREILQIVGTEICRSICESYHVDIVSSFLKSYPNHSFVVVDSRYPNERLMLKIFGARLVLVNRPSLDTSDLHISETSLGDKSEYDMIVENNKSLIELQQKVPKLIRPLYLVGVTI